MFVCSAFMLFKLLAIKVINRSLESDQMNEREFVFPCAVTYTKLELTIFQF